MLCVFKCEDYKISALDEEWVRVGNNVFEQLLFKMSSTLRTFDRNFLSYFRFQEAVRLRTDHSIPGSILIFLELCPQVKYSISTTELHFFSFNSFSKQSYSIGSRRSNAGQNACQPPCLIRKSANFMTSSFTSCATNNHKFYKYVLK